jgi:hypothetical protein
MVILLENIPDYASAENELKQVYTDNNQEYGRRSEVFEYSIQHR